jgi:hypothetical protein
VVTESAFARAQQQGLTPRPTGELDVPMGRIVGWEGGSQGTKAALDKVRIVINPQTFEVITAYPIKWNGTGIHIVRDVVSKANSSSLAIPTTPDPALFVMNAHGTAMAPMM